MRQVGNSYSYNNLIYVECVNFMYVAREKVWPKKEFDVDERDGIWKSEPSYHQYIVHAYHSHPKIIMCTTTGLIFSTSSSQCDLLSTSVTSIVCRQWTGKIAQCSNTKL